jgi:hypothetical protein
MEFVQDACQEADDERRRNHFFPGGRESPGQKDAEDAEYPEMGDLIETGKRRLDRKAALGREEKNEGVIEHGRQQTKAAERSLLTELRHKGYILTHFVLVFYNERRPYGHL